MKSIAKYKQSKPFDSELKTCRGNQKKKKKDSAVLYAEYEREAFIFVLFERENIYI